MDNNCFICGKILSEGDTKTVLERGIQSLIKSSIIREDKEHELMLTPLKSIRVHTACQKNYADTRIATTASRKRKSCSSSDSPIPSSSSVSNAENFDFKKFCFICTEEIPENFEEKNNTLPRNSQTKIHVVKQFSIVKNSLLSKLKDRDDEYALNIIARINDVSDTDAAGSKYHRKCYLQAIAPLKPRVKRGRPCEEIEAVVSEIYAYMVNKEECQFKLSDIIKEIEGADVPDIRTLKAHLLQEYGDNITMYEKARIGTVICLKNVGAKILADSFYEEKKPTVADERLRIVKEAAAIVLEDIRSQYYDNSEYPAPDNFMKDVKSSIPESLDIFLRSIMLKDKRAASNKWETKCTSIAHSIIAAVRPRLFCSPLLLGVATLLYRKFASKQLIDTLSALGFGFG